MDDLWKQIDEIQETMDSHKDICINLMREEYLRLYIENYKEENTSNSSSSASETTAEHKESSSAIALAANVTHLQSALVVHLKYGGSDELINLEKVSG